MKGPVQTVADIKASKGFADILHSSCVEVNGRGLLILGPPGSGKSSLALELMSLGAALVSDDQTALELKDHSIWASPVTALTGIIEARGVGLLKCPFTPKVMLAFAIDLSSCETERLPYPKTFTHQDVHIPCLHKPHNTPLAQVLMLLLTQKAELLDCEHNLDISHNLDSGDDMG